MKKIIALFLLMLGVSFTASAQQKTAAKPAATATATDAKQANIQQAAAADLKALNDFIPLSKEQSQALGAFFVHKHQQLADTGLTAERRKLLSEGFEAKLNATLTPDQVTKLSQNPKLLNQLTGKK